MAELKWESIGYNTDRAKVPGGWLIKVVISGQAEYGVGITFYPDPEHKWDGGSLP